MGIFEGPAKIEDYESRVLEPNAYGQRYRHISVRERGTQTHPAGAHSRVDRHLQLDGRAANYSAYATSKGARILFMRSMARELGPEHIRVNCVAPAWSETDMARHSFDVIGRENLKKQFPLEKIGEPEDAAGATMYLLSDLANHMTGITLTVDGGFDMPG